MVNGNFHASMNVFESLSSQIKFKNKLWTIEGKNLKTASLLILDGSYTKKK